MCASFWLWLKNKWISLQATHGIHSSDSHLAVTGICTLATVHCDIAILTKAASLPDPVLGIECSLEKWAVFRPMAGSAHFQNLLGFLRKWNWMQYLLEGGFSEASSWRIWHFFIVHCVFHPLLLLSLLGNYPPKQTQSWPPKWEPNHAL